MTKIARYLFGIEIAQSIITRTFDGEHWYMASDICSLLGISNHSQAVRIHLFEDEYRKESIYIGGYGKKKVLLISNSGLLKLIVIGRSENAIQVREKAKYTPTELKTVDWPAELEITA